MTSKLVVNTIEADTGISSVSFASSISLSSTSKFFFSDAGINIGPDTNINRPATGALGFNINSDEKVRIASNGRVGIGTDSPASLLDIVGGKTGTNLSVDGTVQVNSNQNWNFATLKLTREASNTANSKVISFLLDGDSASATGLYDNVNLILRTNSAPTAGSASTTLNASLQLTAPSNIILGTNGAERFRISSSGQIGLGGANYGTAGQVITSNGSSSAATYQYVNRPAFKAIVSNQASIPHAAWTKVIFDNEVFDTDNAYNPTTGIFTCPTGQDGVYLLSYGVGVDDLQVGEYLQSRPYKNGSGINNGRTIQFAGNPHNNLVVDVKASSLIRLDAGDELAIWIYHNEGGAIPLEANRCEFNLFKLNIGNI